MATQFVRQRPSPNLSGPAFLSTLHLPEYLPENGLPGLTTECRALEVLGFSMFVTPFTRLGLIPKYSLHVEAHLLACHAQRNR